MIKIDGQVAAEQVLATDIDNELNTNGPSMKPEDRARLEGQLAEAKVKLSGLKAEADIQRSKMNDLELHSPIDGQIFTPDVKKLLEGRPVQEGQSLLRVADPNGDWELDLHMPDDRMGEISRAKLAAEQRNEPLAVTYILQSEPGRQLKGTVKEIARSSEIIDKDDGPVVLIKVAIRKGDIDPANPLALSGVTVTGKVHCGRRSLGYVWFHDLFAFIQAKVLFRFF